MRPTVFAAQSVVTGSAQLLGGLLGGLLLARAVDPRSVFALSGALRLGIVVLLIRMLPRTARDHRTTRAQFRVAGFRAGSGLVQRPIDPLVSDTLPKEPERPVPTTDAARRDSMVSDTVR